MCLNPLRAEPQEFGRPKFDPEGTLLLPCGKCIDCKKLRATEFALRAKHEIMSNPDNIFLTLTYDEDHLNSKRVIKDEFQKFIKKLRKQLNQKIKYMVSHEYGGKTGRPHHHAIIFNYSPKILNFTSYSKRGHPQFNSPEISALWKQGFHTIGDANAKTAYYITSYALKATEHEILDENGELIYVKDTFDCSKRTAIGYEYFLQNMEHISQTERLPRYYKTLLERFGRHDLLMAYEQRMSENIKEDDAYKRFARNEINLTNLKLDSETRKGKTLTKEDYAYREYLKKQRV